MTPDAQDTPTPQQAEAPTPVVETPAPVAPEAPKAAPPADQPAAATERGGAPDKGAAATPPKAEKPKSEVEKLIERLGGSAPAEPPTQTVDEKPEPEGTEAPATAKTDADDDLPKEALTPEQAAALKPGEAKRKINRLIERMNESRPYADLGKEIVEQCQQSGLAPDDYRAWVQLGLGVHSGDQRAVQTLQRLMVERGLMPEVKAPAAPTWGVEDERWLAKLTTEGAISPEAADSIRERLDKRLAAPKAAEAAPAPQAPAARPQPVAAPQDADRARGMADLEDRFIMLKAKLPPADSERILGMINQELARYQGVSPRKWGEVFDAVSSTVMERVKKAAVKPVPTTSIRPGTTAAPSQPVFKSEVERLVHKWSG